MLGIVLGVAYQVNSAILTILEKGITQSLSDRKSLGTHIFFVPIGILGIILSYGYNPSPVSNNLPWFYILVGAFSFTVTFNIYLGFHLLKNINITALFKYETGLTLFLALISDLVFFHIFPSLFSVTAGILLLVSGSLLTKELQKTPKSRWLLLKLFIAAFGIVLSITLLKQIVLISTNAFLSIFITQTLTHFAICLFGLDALGKIIRDKRLLILSLVHDFLILSLVLIEFYAFRLLSTFVIIALSSINFIVYLLFDWYKKDLHITQKTLFGIIMGFLGIISLVYANM